MSWYVVSPSTFVRKLIMEEELMYVSFDMVLGNLLVVESGS